MLQRCQGGLEFLPRHSTLSAPFFLTRPPSLPAHLPSVTMMAVDILPTSLPRDASIHFSNALMPYLRSVIRSYRPSNHRDAEMDASAYDAAIQRATVASGGALRETHKWLEGPLDAWRAEAKRTQARSPTRKKRVLVFGSGMVAGPAIREIVKGGDVELVVGTH